MKIVDARTTTKKYKVVVFIERALKEIEPQLLRGIRHIVLLDHDTYAERNACGRYVPVVGTSWHDIELYFKHYSETPSEISENHVFVGAMTLRTLLHEIYHHKLSFHHHARHPAFKVEQDEATRWAEDQLGIIVTKVFAGEEYKQQREELYKIAKSNQAL